MIASPIRMSDTPVKYHRAPPMLGEHTTEILSRYRNESEIQALKNKGVIEHFSFIQLDKTS